MVSSNSFDERSRFLCSASLRNLSGLPNCFDMYPAPYSNASLYVTLAGRGPSLGEGVVTGGIVQSHKLTALLPDVATHSRGTLRLYR